MRLPWGKRADPTISMDQWANMFQYGGLLYPLMGGGNAYDAKQERPDQSFEGYARALYKGNAVVFACMDNRMKLFTEARFKFRQLRAGRPGNLFGNSELALLETPWPNGTTGDLLARAIQDVDLAGNFYAYRQGGALRRMRPDWVSIVLGSESGSDRPDWEIDAEILGYLYKPGGPRSPRDPIGLLVDEVAHWAPIPDPCARYRGMSWLTPVINEVLADGAATTHKLKYFENAATPNIAVKLDPAIQLEAFNKWVEKFKEGQEGVANAYKTLFLGGGADVTVIGSNLEQQNFKVTQGAGETRIAAASGMPPVVVGLSEGLAAATYSNYAQARRRAADQTMRPLWRSISGALSSVIRVPSGAELWYDDRDIPALREDEKDAAEIRGRDAATIKQLVDAGFTPKSAIAAVAANDMGLLSHSGLVSVQLQPPGAQNTNGAAPALTGP